MKKDTKKIIISLALTVLAVSGCYDDYTMDYEWTAAYVAYQYDLRTFVVGEGMKFDFTVAFAGSENNNKDRKINVIQDDNLLSEDLSVYTTEFGVKSFYALDGLLGNGQFGDISQNYVSTEVKASGISALTPLPSEYYDITGLDDLKIKKGRHTGTATIKATDAIIEDEKALKPYYALGFRILDADVDSVLIEKSFEIIAVKVESQFFGYWYHGGSSVTKKDDTGEVLSQEDYTLSLPQADAKVYTLSTVSAHSVMTDKVGQASGKLLLSFSGNQIDIASGDGKLDIRPIEGRPSYFNDAKLLQDRKLYLNYCYSNGDGSTTYVTDCLEFRNRIRDGINEWQDENSNNYK